MKYDRQFSELCNKLLTPWCAINEESSIQNKNSPNVPIQFWETFSKENSVKMFLRIKRADRLHNKQCSWYK